MYRPSRHLSRTCKTMEGSILNITVGIPTAGQIEAQTVACLMDMRKTTDFEFYIAQSSLIMKNRRKICGFAMKLNSTHVLMIDSDMTFPPDTLERLLAHDKPVIAANCVYKRDDVIKWTAYHKVGKKDSKMIDSAKMSGIQKVWRVGTGVMLINVEVLKELGLPWFLVAWNPMIGQEQGEDYFFCQRLEEKGIDLWVDHDLSKEIGHIGTKVFTGVEQKRISDV